MSHKIYLPFLLLIVGLTNSSCSTNFESTSAPSNNGAIINSTENTNPGTSEVSQEGNATSTTTSSALTDLLAATIERPTPNIPNLSVEDISIFQDNSTIKYALYNQVDSAIKVQTTSKQTRPKNLPLCTTLTQLTSLFGCSMYTLSGARKTKKLTADIKIFLANPSKKSIDKVAFIIASHNFENPASINHEALYSSHPEGAKKIYDQLALQGVSVVFIGFGYKDFYLNSIFDKAQATARAIQLVNKLKTSKDPSFLIGFSLGGVIARIALNYLEVTGANLHNINHYVSFDSPHRGAHVALSLQHIMQFLERGAKKAKSVAKSFQNKFGFLIDKILNLDNLSDQLDDGIKSADLFTNQVKLFSSTYLNSDFAQELVIQQVSKEDSNYTHPSYSRLQKHLNTTGMPKMTKSNIGITNGSIKGITLPLSGNQFLSLDTKKRNYVEIDFVSSIAKSSNEYLFKGMFRYPDPKELGGLFGGSGTDKYNYKRKHTNSVLDLDRSTCGYLNSARDIQMAISEQLKTIFSETLKVTNSKVCFIPTSSGLASRKSITYKGPITAQDSLFDEIIGGLRNSHHLTFTSEISNGILRIIKQSY